MNLKILPLEPKTEVLAASSASFHVRVHICVGFRTQIDTHPRASKTIKSLRTTRKAFAIFEFDYERRSGLMSVPKTSFPEVCENQVGDMKYVSVCIYTYIYICVPVCILDMDIISETPPLVQFTS